jgi:hypothetical protein
MGDLSTATATATAATTSPAVAYLAPHLRGAVAVVAQEQPKMDATNFPCLGAKPRPKTIWQKVTVAAPVATPVPVPVAVPVAAAPIVAPKYKATVDACLEKERLDQAQRKKQPETDFNKMTTEEKLAAGWTTLTLNRAAVLAFLDKLEAEEFPECNGSFTFAEMAALCTNYEKRAVKEMNVYRDKGAKAS